MESDAEKMRQKQALGTYSTHSSEIIKAQYAFIRDEFPKDRYNPAITKACFEWLLELFHRRFAMDLGDNDGKAVEI